MIVSFLEEAMEYRREIDGLRALAVLPVILFHAGIKSFEGGYIGVDIFFVISGYLITTIILSDMNKGEFSIVTFYERRARRILPALFFVMFCCLPFAWLWLLPNHFKNFSRSLIAVSSFSSNFFFWKQSGYFSTAAELKPLLHTWSLSVEEQYYILFPLFLMALWRLRKRLIFGSLIAVCVISLILSQWGAYHEPTATFFLLHTRAWEIAIGAIIAFYFLYKREQVELITSHRIPSELFGSLGLALICYSIFAFNKTTPFPSLYALIPTIGTALIIIFSNSKTFVGRLLSTKIMVGIGLLSYSAYLWHQPLFVFARHRSLQNPSISLLLLLSVFSIVLAYLSWRFVEVPFRNKITFNKKKIFTFSIIGSIFFITFGFTGKYTNGFLFRSPDSANMSKYVEECSNSGIGCMDNLTKNSSVSSACKIGQTNNKPSFIIFGDSHAGSFIAELNNVSKSIDISGLNYTYSSCPPLMLGKHPVKDPIYDVCEDLRESFFSNLNTEAIPHYVILTQRWTLMMEQVRYQNQEGGNEYGEDYTFTNKYTESLGYQNALEKDFIDSVTKIIESGRKVIIIYPIPEMGWNVPDLLMKNNFIYKNINAACASTSYDAFKKRNLRTYQALDKIVENKNIIRIYPEKIFCNNYIDGRCIAHIDGVPLYYDDDHLSFKGTKMIIDDILIKTENFKF
jgi:peptidoglycan/LPS O-acetylase OafA/YrhL